MIKFFFTFHINNLAKHSVNGQISNIFENNYFGGWVRLELACSHSISKSMQSDSSPDCGFLLMCTLGDNRQRIKWLNAWHALGRHRWNLKNVVGFHVSWFMLDPAVAVVGIWQMNWNSRWEISLCLSLLNKWIAKNKKENSTGAEKNTTTWVEKN